MEKARVLSLEELVNTVICFEERKGCLETYKTEVFRPQPEIVVGYTVRPDGSVKDDTATTFFSEEYGMGIRYWNVEPTEEEMRATPWKTR